MRLSCALMVLVSLLALSACATRPTTFAWSSYEDLIYETYAKPGSLSPEEQISRREADFQKLQASGKPLHPGFHAQLGYLYSRIGKPAQAIRHFEQEATQFPESKRLMNRFIQRLKHHEERESAVF